MNNGHQRRVNLFIIRENSYHTWLVESIKLCCNRFIVLWRIICKSSRGSYAFPSSIEYHLLLWAYESIEWTRQQKTTNNGIEIDSSWELHSKWKNRDILHWPNNGIYSCIAHLLHYILVILLFIEMELIEIFFQLE